MADGGAPARLRFRPGASEPLGRLVPNHRPREAGWAAAIARALAAYEAEHRRTTWPIDQGTNAVVTLFTDERPLARVLRPAVLALAGQAPGLRTLVRGLVTRQLTGRALTA